MRIERSRTALVAVGAGILATLAASTAHAAARLVVVPVTVGSGEVPPADLMGGLVRGLQENLKWVVESGESLKVPGARAPSLDDQQVGALSERLGQAVAALAQGRADDAATAVEQIRGDLAKAAATGPLGEKGFALAYRAGALLVAALQSGQAERAKAVAGEISLAYPGRKAVDGDQIPPAAAELLAAAPQATGPKLTLQTRPEGCEIFVNETSVGKSPRTLVMLPGTVYYAYAACPPTGGAHSKSYARKISVLPDEPDRNEILDVTFEKALTTTGGVQLHFSSSDERRQLEESYARRVVERLDAEFVVLASVGELNGSDWLNARLYLKSGYLNRQGLVRMEVTRTVALGRYLNSGRDVPGVLKPEEAGALVAAAQAQPVGRVSTSPWYTDVLGWCLTGAGVAAVTAGLWARSLSDSKLKEGDALRDDPDRQQRLYLDSQNLSFWGDIGLVGGGLLGITGILLLAIPDAETTQKEFFTLAPARGGGATLWLSGTF